jgi:hypothetical protein
MLLTSKQASKRLGVSEGTLRNWRSEGIGPKFIRQGWFIRYLLADIVKWKREKSMNIQIEWRGHTLDIDFDAHGEFSDGGLYEAPSGPEIDITAITVCDADGVEHSAMWLLDEVQTGSEIQEDVMNHLEAMR